MNTTTPTAPDQLHRDLTGWTALRIAALPVFITVAVALVLRSISDPIVAVSTFSTRFLGIFIEAAPFLLLGAIASGLLEVFVKEDYLARFLPRQPVLAAGAGACLGFAFPVCECGVVPVTRRLFAKGLPLSAGVAFLLGSPVLNPIVLVSTWSAFGWGTVLIARFAITLVVATVVGVLFATRQSASTILRQSPSHHPTSAGPRAPLRTQLGSAVTLASDEFLDMGRYLIAGSLLAAGLQTVVSPDLLSTLGRSPVTSVLTMQALAYVLSVCSTVDAFLALSFQGTFTTASLLAFLTFGPMVDIKSTLMFLSVFRPRAVLYLIGLPLLLTMSIAIWLNLNIIL